MSRFEIQPLSRFAGSSAAIRRPKEIAYFSYDDDHQYHLDERSLRYYYPPRIDADLSRGFDTFKQLDDSADDHIDSLLKTLMALEGETRTKCEADIITWRGMMTKLMAVPFDHMTAFIEENHDYKLEQRHYQNSQPQFPGGPSHYLMSYWGYKFETLSLLPSPWDDTSREFIESREDLVVNNHAQYCSIVKTGIGKAKMILGGEVDAVWDCKPSNPDQPIKWVELKTSAEIHNDKDMLKYERKLLKFWIQSFLLGVPKIVVGFRDRHGFLQRLEELQTQDIPSLVKRNGRGTWDGNLCINFAASFLDWLKRTITTDGVYRIRRKRAAYTIDVFKLEETGSGDILSQDFLAWRNNRNPSSAASSALGGIEPHQRATPDGDTIA
ncbi:decapping endonuclease targeting mRNA [Loxospora ochrophaea]|nr:decapping endonuclease targeting mRNA [Loxospora ochrophaea]